VLVLVLELAFPTEMKLVALFHAVSAVMKVAGADAADSQDSAAPADVQVVTVHWYGVPPLSVGPV